ncbi:hypothetical protein QJS10_CPA16g01226 [Acorus calamus]|uniref:N-acetyltransferase domain-containing protein n=1 Tax=Acorus calamus TaxID=4465 RepID=A0AAV9CXV5_ACOCL|nr:hypothetical protein QJS10_CPA16g01226 [Acorus calamus]
MAIRVGCGPHVQDFPLFQKKSPFLPLRVNRAAFTRKRLRNISCAAKIPSSFGEKFPVSRGRWKFVEVQCKDASPNLSHSITSGNDESKHPELSFDRLQPSEEELCEGPRRAFGNYVARSALLDEEYWTAAYLRAEGHCESGLYVRHVENFKREYAAKEYYALKRRCAGRDGNSMKCTCMIAVKKEEPNVRRNVLKSVVGTLDISIRRLLQGENFPGEIKKTSSVLFSNEDCDSHKYAYIANVCVAKFARRQGIASNMLCLATDIATLEGMKQLYIHANADNKTAQDLYLKAGFQVVEAASALDDPRILMWKEL